MRKAQVNGRDALVSGTVKTLLVDDSQIVANLMVVICTKIGITNYDEYGLVRSFQLTRSSSSSVLFTIQKYLSILCYTK